MPWCEECAKFQPPGSLSTEGDCPDCGTKIGEPPHVPWHFKLLVVAITIYLGWRTWQGVDWLIHHL